MANEYMKICLISLIITEMEIKIIMRYPFKPIKMATINNNNNNNNNSNVLVEA